MGRSVDTCHICHICYGSGCKRKSLSMLSLVVNAILTSVFLNKFVMNLVSFPTYVNLAHFVLRVSCFLSFLFVLLTLCKIEMSYLMLSTICFNFSYSICVLVGFRLCSRGWHESLGIMVSVKDGFLYILKLRLCSFPGIVTSKKLILCFASSSKVKLRLGTVLLKASRTSCMLVLDSLYMIRI